MADKNWRMFYGMSADFTRGSAPIIYGGDDIGKLHVVDPRLAGRAVNVYKAHKTKITCVDVNTHQSELLLTASK